MSARRPRQSHRATLPPLYDEIWEIELRPLNDPASLISAVAQTVDVSASVVDARSLAAALRQRKRLLLVLDNCEHILDEVGTLTDELAVCPNVSILATSRRDLETDDEHVMRLDTLRDSVRASELFVREGRRRSPDIAVSVEDLEVIREICDRLDGIPLAIELAAARTQSLDVQTILARLSDLIATPRRRTRADHGHQTMSDVVDWSTNLLDPDVASGLGTLKQVFPGDFDLDAAEAVLATATTTAAAEIVDELVAHSMLEVVRGGRVRYRLLGPVRQRVSETLLRDK